MFNKKCVSFKKNQMQKDPRLIKPEEVESEIKKYHKKMAAKNHFKYDEWNN